MGNRLVPFEIERLRHLKATGVSGRLLAFRFGISESSVSRYVSDEKRAKSRDSMKGKSNQKEQTCFRCGMAIDNHPRCKRCTILIHSQSDFCEDHQTL